MLCNAVALCFQFIFGMNVVKRKTLKYLNFQAKRLIHCQVSRVFGCPELHALTLMYSNYYAIHSTLFELSSLVSQTQLRYASVVTLFDNVSLSMIMHSSIIFAAPGFRY